MGLRNRPGDSSRPGHAAELQAIQALAGQILGNLDLETTLLSINNGAVELIDADIAGILLVDDEQGSDVVTMRACTGHRTAETAHLEVRRGQGVAGKVFETRRPFKVDDYLSSTSISRDFFPVAQEEGTRSALGAPMIARDEIIGTLMVWRRRPSTFTDADVRTTTSLANLATIAIVNARLYETERASVRALQKANRQLEEQYGLLHQSADVHEELTQLVLEGKGTSNLIATVAKHTRGQVAVLDTDLCELARSPGASGLAERASRRIERARRETNRGSRGTTIVPSTSSPSRWLVLSGVAAGGDIIAYLCVDLDHEPDRLDTVTIQQAAIVCALQLTRDRAVIEARMRAHADFLWDLLEGNILDEAEALTAAHHLRYKLPSFLRVMLLSVEGLDEWGRTSDTAEAVERHRASLVRTAVEVTWTAGVPDVLAARRGSLIAFMIPGLQEPGDARPLAQTILSSIKERFPDVELAAGLSSCVPMSANLQAAYAQARNALSAAPLVAAGSSVALFDDLGVMRFLVAPGNREDMLGFVRRVLGPLIDYDEAHDSALVETLDTYLASDCTLQATARKLYVHPKTVRYRLTRAEQLAHIDLSRQQDRFDAQLAIAIVRALALIDGHHESKLSVKGSGSRGDS